MKKLSLLTVLAFMTCLGAKAQILEIDNRAAFQAETPGAGDITFESIAPNDYAQVNPLALDGATFTGSGSSGLYLVAAGSPTFSQYGPGDGSTYIVCSATLTIAPPAGNNAVGFDLFNLLTTPAVETGTVTDSLGHTMSYTFTAAAATGMPSLTFLGFVDTYAGATITSITVPQNGSVDNVLFGTGSLSPTVPEPATWAMMVGGLGALLFFRRIRKNNS